ncbi:MAG: NAD-dependent epimerase/dehydratase family protein [Gammaproteobacteria bacterium]|nr:NAD-dependent epimerase/dehydratase family protein [Gammaproteobacteria bacterium]
MPVVVTGASSVVGRYLLPLLAVKGYEVIAISRNPQPVSGSASWIRADISSNQLPQEIHHANTLIHLAPLPLLNSMIHDGKLAALRRVVAIGTTSVFTKINSPVRSERDAMKTQQSAERLLASDAQNFRFSWTLFRPTLVYDGVHDKNVTRILRFISKYGFFPVASPATGLRQPLHASDLAQACAGVLDNPVTELKSYNLAGNQVLSYREMIEELFRILEKNPRVISVPSWVYQIAIMLVRMHPRFRYLNTGMIERMNMDMVFDIKPAQHDFGFSPRRFLPVSCTMNQPS